MFGQGGVTVAFEKRCRNNTYHLPMGSLVPKTFVQQKIL